MKNKGFTLVELLLVIALIGILSVLIVPNFINIFKNTLDKDMQVIENNVRDAAELYEYDHCIEPLYDPLTKEVYTCPESYKENKYICLSELTSGSEPYIDNVKYNKTECKGFIQFGDVNKTYLYCEDDYTTDKTIDTNLYQECLN